jgi:hypothetical protein
MFYELSTEFDRLRDVLLGFGLKDEEVERMIALILHEITENIKALRK